MTLEDNVELNPIAHKGPGERLKAARERHRLDVDEVANRLYLKSRMVAAIEANDYTNMPSLVFTRGYLRNYARLVEEPVDEVLKEFERSLSVEATTVNNVRVVQGRHREMDSSHISIKWINRGVMVVTLVLFLIWVVGQFMGEKGLFSGWGDDAPAPVESAEESPASTTVIEPESATTFTQLPLTESTGGVFEPAETPSAEAQPVPPEPTEVVGEEGIVVELKGSSFVDIRDASGDYKLLGEMKSGERHVLGGTPPYEVMLSNATAVNLRVDGVPYDMSEHQSGAMARFTLGETAPEGEAAAEASVASQSDELLLELRGDCWVEVKDSTGEFRLMGTLKKGSKHKLGGKPPYSMVFGKSEVVRLLVNGSPYSLESLQRGGVARFTYPPSE